MTKYTGLKAAMSTPMGRAFTSALPLMALAIPAHAQAQTAQNTASVSAPAGAIEIDPSNNTVTDTDTVLAALVATNDDATGVDGSAGAANVLNILGNDTTNGVTSTTGDVTITVADGSTVPPELTFDPATGSVGVAAGTPAGTYSFEYTICETANPTNCQTATVSITVAPPVITADDDSVTAVNGTDGAADVLDVLDGDTLNGTPVTAGDVIVTVTTPADPINSGPVPTLDPATGLISVPEGTPAGDYTITYQICDPVNPAVCDEGVATVNVIPAEIVADDDAVSGVDGTAGGTAVNVLDGDTLGGTQAPLDDVTLSVVTPATPIDGGPVPALDPATGDVIVPPGTPAGTYTITYEVCEVLNPTNCDQAVVTVVVDAPAIIADADSVGGVNGADGAADVLDVLDGDTLNGTPITAGDVTLTVDTPATPINGGPVPILDTTSGLVSVPAGTPAGDYTITYQICDPVNPSNCDTAEATVTVEPPAIVADADSVTAIDGTSGANDVLDVLDGDTLNGVQVTLADVDVSVLSPATPINGGPVPTLDPATGQVSVPAGTPAGTYEITYQICETLNPANCTTAIATVEVDALEITADPDSVTGADGVNGGAGILDVLDGDTIGGDPATPANVVLTVVTPATSIDGGPVPTLDPATGLVDLPAGTPAGTYEIVYQICDPLNPANCVTETATVVVAPSVDLSITKTNGADAVTSGDTITYTLVVSNAGPDAATGAVVSDTPGAGLTCPATNVVTISGDGIPAGSFTISDLTTTGITLGTLGDGQSATITYTCTVN